MASWVGYTTTSSGGNISMRISGGYDSVSHSGTTVSFNYGVRFQQATSTWTSNSIAAFVGGTRYYAKVTGASSSGTWYYANSGTATHTSEAVPFSYSGDVGGYGSGSVSVSVGSGWNAYTPSNKYTYTFSVPYSAANLWNDINVLNPSSTQDYASGYFDLYISNTGTTYTDLTNEKDTTQPYGTYFEVYNIRPYYDYYTLDYVDGYDSIPSSGHYRKTFDAPNEVMTIKMKYASFSFNLNILDPNGSEPYSTGAAGSIDFSTDNGSTYTRVYNEPASSYVYGTQYRLKDFQPGTGMHFSSLTGATLQSDGTYTATQGTSAVVITVNTAWDTYSIAYDANGGTGAPSAQTKTYGTDLTLSSTTPTKSSSTATGYTVTFDGNGGTASKTSQAATDTTTYSFSSWKDTSGTTYAAGGTYTKNQADTLTAQWSSSTTKGAITTATATKSNGTATRTVTYDANGGTCATTSQNSTATITYTCNGWWTAASGGTKRTTSGGSYTPSSSETVYAQYDSSTGTYSAITSPTPSKASTTATRTVTFDANGGTCSTTSLNSTQTTTYTQNGWWTATSGGTQVVAANTSYTPSATQTVYAQYTSSTGSWTAITLPAATKANGTATCTITFDGNGGSTPTAMTSTATITYSQTGWWTAASGGTSRGASGASYTPSAAETVYAQFNPTTGTYTSITLPTPTRSGYKFIGWGTSSTATTGITGTYTPTGSTTLYAVWVIDQASMYVKEYLPNEYQEVEYIASSKAQYIDLDINLFDVSDHKIDITFSLNSLYNYNSIYGSTYDPDKMEGWVYASGLLAARYNTIGYGTDTTVSIDTKYNAIWEKAGTTLTATLNGISIGSGTSSTITPTTSVLLFKSGTDYGDYKLYKCKLYKSDILVSDLIPCYRKTDNVIGLYDIIRKIFFTTPEDTPFTKGDDVSTGHWTKGKVWYKEILPSGYQLVDYITLDGNEYIDTDISVDLSNTRAVITAEKTSGKDGFLLGARDSSSNQFALYLDTDSGLRYDYNTSQNNITVNTLNKNTYILEKNKLIINDNVMYTNTISTNKSTQSLYVGWNRDADTQYQFKGNIYGFSIYDGDSLMMSCKPCYRTSDNVIGFYDTINNVFYVNSGTGTFTKGNDSTGWSKAKTVWYKETLPVEYQEVDYIKSDGNCYINTGYYPTNNTTVEFTAYNIAEDQFIYGSRTSAAAVDSHTFTFNANSPWFQFSNDQGNISTTLALNSIYSVRIGQDGAYLNSTLVHSYVTKSFTSTLPMYIFSLNQNGSLERSFTGRLYNLSIYESGILVHNYKPCYRKSDSVIGVYDTIDKIFYPNEGTGTFTKGNDVSGYWIKGA